MERRHHGLANARLRRESELSSRNQGESRDMGWRPRKYMRWGLNAAAVSGLLQDGRKLVLRVEVKVALMLKVLIPQGCTEVQGSSKAKGSNTSRLSRF